MSGLENGTASIDAEQQSGRNCSAHVSSLPELLLAGGWSLLTLAVAAYTLLKPSTTAADLLFIPGSWIAWLDANYDLRTLVMTLAILLLPACLLSTPETRSWRRGGLLLGTGCLLGLEFAQLWIPTRGFAWSDMGYTLAGGLLAELAAGVCQWLRIVAKHQLGEVFPPKPRE